jgi:hypothetical protein
MKGFELKWNHQIIPYGVALLIKKPEVHVECVSDWRRVKKSCK